MSICCLTYNHAKYIRQCMDGFLMQETDFPVEILVHDDASTDGTDVILREYEVKYPDKIFPIYEKENKFSQGYRGRMDLFNYTRARGRYIAYCEGDDYWTDPHKLQKQVDFMESHLDYSVCFHRCQRYNENTGRFSKDKCGYLFSEGQEGVEVTIDMCLDRWITQPLTMMFRCDMFDPCWRQRYRHYRDMHEIYHLLCAGKGYLFAFFGGVYRMHSGGVASQISPAEYCKVSLPTDREFYHKTHHPQARRIYGDTLQTCVNVYAGTNKCKAIYYAVVELAVNRQFKTFGKNFMKIFNGR